MAMKIVLNLNRLVKRTWPLIATMRQRAILILMIFSLVGCSSYKRHLPKHPTDKQLEKYFIKKGWDNAFMYSSPIDGSREIWSYKGDSIFIESYVNHRLNNQKVIHTDTAFSISEIDKIEKDRTTCLHCGGLYCWAVKGDSTFTKLWTVDAPYIVDREKFESRVVKDLKNILLMYYTFNDE